MFGNRAFAIYGLIITTIVVLGCGYGLVTVEGLSLPERVVSGVLLLGVSGVSVGKLIAMVRAS